MAIARKRPNESETQPPKRVRDPPAEDLQQQRHDLRQRKEQTNIGNIRVQLFEVQRHQPVVHIPTDVRKDHRRQEQNQQAAQ